MSLKKVIASIFVFTFLFSSLTTAAWAGEAWRDYYQQYLAKDLVSQTKAVSQVKKMEMYLIDEKSGDVTGDGIKDNIWLIGRKAKGDSAFAQNLFILVQNGRTEKITAKYLENLAGYDSKLFVGDFTGDRVKDIMITAPTEENSVGKAEYRIITWKNSKPVIIFGEEENAGVEFTLEFLDGFKVQLDNQYFKKPLTLNLNHNKKAYIKKGIYDSKGILLKEVEGSVLPFSELKPVDLDEDGIYELQGQQRIVGALGTDNLAQVKSIWKFTSGEFKVRKIQLSISSSLNDGSRSGVVNWQGRAYFPQIDSLNGKVIWNVSSSVSR